MILSFKCVICQSEFERYVPPGDKKQSRDFCSRSCQMKKTRSLNDSMLSGITNQPCTWCNEPMNGYSRASRPRKFCSTSCRSRFAVANGSNCMAKNDVRIAAGTSLIKLDKEKQRKSFLTVRRNTDNLHSEDTKNKISKSCTGISNALKGKTFTEFYGEARGKQLAKNHSTALKLGYAEGRLNPTARSQSAPTFRGVRLRSKLEQTVIELLEFRDGLVFNETLLYESKETYVTWYDLAGNSHTYIPDLHDIVRDVVYEVKPQWLINAETDEMKRKRLAVESTSRKFEYISDTSFRSQEHTC